MLTTQQLNRWHLDLAAAIKALGSDAFFPALVHAVSSQVKINYPQVWLYHRDLPPQVLYHAIPQEAVASQIDHYLQGPFREDPFFQVSMNRPKAAIYRLSRLTAGNLHGSRYYTTYYVDTGTVDEAVYLAKLQGGNVINLSMMRLPALGEFSDSEYQHLHLLAEPVAALITAHTELADFAKKHLIQPGINHQINTAFRTFGSSLLSPREKDVLEMMLRGYGTDTTAQRLRIAVETVRRHRKSIYRKLDVSSQIDLFSLFINALACIGDAEGCDPLAVYMAPTPAPAEATQRSRAG